MPQQIPGGIQWEDELTPKIPGGVQWEDEQPKKKEKQPDDWIETGLRTIPAVAGSLIGGFGAGIPSLGLGAVGGGMAGGALGSAVGNVLGNWYSGEEFNPYEFGVETALGAVPPIFGPVKYAGKGLGAIARYAGKNALSGAVEGGLVSMGGTPFQEWAETGNIVPSLERVVGAGVSGATLGGALGGAIGGYHGFGLNKAAPAPPVIPPKVKAEIPLVPPSNVPPPPVATQSPVTPPINHPASAYTREPWMPFGRLPTDRPPRQMPPELTETLPLPFDDEQQLGLPLGAYKNPAGRFTGTGPSMPPVMRPFTIGEFEPKLDLGESIPFNNPPIPPPPPAGGTPVIPPKQTPATVASQTIEIPKGSTLSPDGLTVTIHDADNYNTRYWRGKGYVTVKGLLSAENKPMMVRGDVAPMYISGEMKPPAAAAVAINRPEFAGPLPKDAVVAGDVVKFPNSTADNPKFAANMAKNYITLSRDANETKYKRRTVQDEGPAFEVSGPEDPIDAEEIRARLTRMLGREPTEQEIQGVIDNQKSPVEPSQGVAEFPDSNDVGKRTRVQGERFWEAALNDPRNEQPPIDPAKLQQFADDLRAQVQRPSGDINTLRQQNVLGSEGQIPFETIRPAIQGVDRPAPVHPGQQELPWSRGENPQPFDGDALTRERAQNAREEIARDMPVEGEQLSMRGPMQDAEITNFLRNEDATPPEMRDLSDYDPNEGPLFDINEPRNFGPGKGNLMHGTEGRGLGKTKTFEEQWDQAIVEANILGIDWHKYENLNELQWDITRKTATETIRTGKNPLNANSDEGPTFARAKGGGLTASVDVRRAVENITKDYTSPLPAIQVREGMQNGMDAADASGDTVKVRLDENGKTIEVYDNGKGLTEDQLANKLVEIFATGKEGEAGATGGKGIGSASYIYGGEYFSIDTVAIDPTDGIKYRIIAKGTPEQFLDPVKGSDFEKIPVDQQTPTGTTIKVLVKEDHDVGDARNMVKNIVYNSRNRSSRIVLDETGHTLGTPLSRIEPDGFKVEEYNISSSKDDNLIGEFTTENRNSDVEILTPKTFDTGPRDNILVHYLNNGMYQFSEVVPLKGTAEGVPESMLIDIHPLVDDVDELYPFINTREDIKKDIRQEIYEFINKNVASPGLSRRKNRIQELYDSMGHVPVKGAKRRTTIYDPGKRLDPDEMDKLKRSPAINSLLQIYDQAIEQILNSVGRETWSDRLEGVGIVLDPNMHGVHIPNPTTGKSTILINPFLRINRTSLSPRESAWRNSGTVTHEVAHIGKEAGMDINFSPADQADPRIMQIINDYHGQLVEHGDTGVYSTGHGMGFAHRLGEVYAKFGVDARFQLADRIHQIFTGGKSGGYSPEIQDLLHVYNESRGRNPTTEDLLSGTGTKQASGRSAGTSNVPSDRQPNGEGTTRWGKFKQATGVGMGGVGKKERKYTAIKEALAIPSNATTMLDLSAPGRQGLPLIFTTDFWKAAGKMFKGLDYESFKEIDAELRNKDFMRRTIDAEGNELPSMAEIIGTKMFSPASEPGPRAEATASKWLENIPILGYPIRAFNRAFITFLNHLNVNRTEKLLNLARDMSIEAFDKGSARTGFLKQKFTKEEALELNPYKNIVLAKEIAEFVNAATGHATNKGGLSLENAVSKIGPALFSPGLLRSRIRLLNPATYVMASPYVRKQYAKAAISTAVAWLTSTTLIKNAAGQDAEVNDDWTSADFGKVRVGNARLDLSGGFGPFVVALSRLMAGGSTSSASGEFHRFGSGYQATTQEDMMERFMVNKLNPIAKFAWDVASASEYNPFHVGDRTAQLFVPLFIQDLKEIAAENPNLLPLFGTAAAFGGGTQVYSKGESVAKLVPEEKDWLVTGGGLKDVAPWNWGNEPGEESRPFPWSER